MEFKRQTNRATKMDKTTNINLFLKDFDIGVCTSKYWGDFEYRKDPLITLTLDRTQREYSLEEFKKILRLGIEKNDYDKILLSKKEREYLIKKIDLDINNLDALDFSANELTKIRTKLNEMRVKLL